MENTKTPHAPRFRGTQRHNTRQSHRNGTSYFKSGQQQIQGSGETSQISDRDKKIASASGHDENYPKFENVSPDNKRISKSSPRNPYILKTFYESRQNSAECSKQQLENNLQTNRTEYNLPKVTKDIEFAYEPVAEKCSSRGAIVSGRYIRNNFNKNSSTYTKHKQKLYGSKSEEYKQSTSSPKNTSISNEPQGFPNTTHFPLNYRNSKHGKDEHYQRDPYQQNFYQDSGAAETLHKVFMSEDSCSRTNNIEEKNFVEGTSSSLQKHLPKDIQNVKKTHFEKIKDSYSNTRAYKVDATQRERLLHHIYKGDCECLVCCDHIRVKDQTWHCLSCFHIFHLRCIRKWARSPVAVTDDGDWRCPACQNLSKVVPFDYYCFCGKRKNPEVDYHTTPHSCGEICGRSRGKDCPHKCNSLCHPGPCSPCSAVLQKECACGKTIKTVPCNQPVVSTCDLICGKLLNCGLHTCPEVCHLGSCSSCQVNIYQNCFCGKAERQVLCQKETFHCKNYSCGEICGKSLNCGHHECNMVCHADTCNSCSLSPELIKTCPCGKVSLVELAASDLSGMRKSCIDPIPVCSNKCSKTLVCGPKESPHLCQSDCHLGSCPPCSLSTKVKCRCGSSVKKFPCETIVEPFVYVCEKRCNRKKKCGRHKCLNVCCVDTEHTCNLICNKKLSCDKHNCEEVCHLGNCPTCWNVSFDELLCFCGTAVLYPPIPCGTKPPECLQPCTRNHACDHKVHHNCHSEDECPPCTFLTSKWCFGHHKLCGSVMCFLDSISCGYPCLKPLPCGNHKCQRVCHPDSCQNDETKCIQLCETPRESCGHPCGIPCHDGPCPETSCKAQVNLVCPCGHRSEMTSCSDSLKSYHLFSVSILASKMQEIKDGQSVNIDDVLGKKIKNNRLQCNEECAVLERNKRLAVALQIQNPELSCSPGPPTYSEFLKTETQNNLPFVSDVYEKITELVQLAKQSKQKCRSHAFPSMNRDHRRVIHELAEFFGCETQSYDEEPKKNVVVTAHKSKCWLPFVSVVTVVQKEMGIRLGIRKGPAPVPMQRDPKARAEAKLDTNSAKPDDTTTQKKKIDYFDYDQ